MAIDTVAREAAVTCDKDARWAKPPEAAVQVDAIVKAYLGGAGLNDILR
jgi:hypothetical protein